MVLLLVERVLGICSESPAIIGTNRKTYYEGEITGNVVIFIAASFFCCPSSPTHTFITLSLCLDALYEEDHHLVGEENVLRVRTTRIRFRFIPTVRIELVGWPPIQRGGGGGGGCSKTFLTKNYFCNVTKITIQC